jgi:phenylpropionate dioxygenase-like ring-hydroxylating dioxygenase large terminal subunit
MFLKNCWYVGAWDHELIDGKLLSRVLLNERLLLYRGESGKAFAVSDRCPHRGALLSQGRLEGDAVRCMYHGIKFDCSGKCVQIPGQEMIPPKMRLRAFPVHEVGHLVWIWMGDPALADVSKIVSLPYMTDPAWKGLPGYLHYRANYLLIVDNLSDLAHLAFVHTNTLGGSEDYAYVSKPASIEKNERGYTLERWHLNIDPPPFHRKVISDKRSKLDRRNRVNMIVPGIFDMATLFAPAGQGADKGVTVPGTREYRNCQFMTPETDKTTHFFWAYLNNFEGADSTISQSLLNSLIEGFHEDKSIIERQQLTLEDDPAFEQQMLAIHADAPLVHFRRTLTKLLGAERESDARAAASG